VVGLQEVDDSWSRSGSVDQAYELAAALEMDFRFFPNLDCSALDQDGDGFCRYGTAVLSRLAVVPESERTYRLPGRAGDEPRGLGQVSVAVGRRWLTVFNTHLGLRRDTRVRQVRAILRILSQAPEPYVLLGDFNATPASREIGLLRSRLVDAAGVAHLRRPTAGNRRIDYIFASRGVRVIRAFIPSGSERRVSDHRPLVARLRLP
jgi:endonuclease/exonuclease/phosphatase family metal-dependent hydrolase